MSLSLLLALVLAPAPRDASVEIDRASFHALTATSPAQVAVPAWAARRTLTVTPAPGGVLLRVTWTLRSLTANAWFSGQVLGDTPGLRVEDVRWNGKSVVGAVGLDGVTVAMHVSGPASLESVTVAGRVSGRAVLEVVAFVPGDPLKTPVALRVMPATRGEVVASAPAGLVPLLRASTDTGDGRDPAPLLPAKAGGAASAGPGAASTGVDVASTFLGAAAVIDLSFGTPPAAPGTDTAVVVARAGLGLTVGDAELRGRGRLVWELRRGSVSSVSFTTAGIGADLEVTGPGVREVQRSGDQVNVLLQAPVSGRLELALRWTSPIGKAAESRVALPQIRFAEVFRAEASLQLARDGEVEAVPEAQGWTPSSAASLPAWGQGLVEGAPTAAFMAATEASGHLDLLRFVPIEGPPVVVDVAAYTIATSREGRALMRAHYEVRNERAATLRIRPPAGFEILGVRVAGETAVIARDRDGSWRVPLPRSVDTVSGLLSFPVEVGLLGGEVKGAAWDRRERRSLPLPRLDAPVAVLRVTLHLPPGYRSRLKAGDGEVVKAFTRGEGITYGLGVGAVGAAEADARFQSAVKRWLGNDFGGAQAELDELKKLGAKNENIDRLQGNLDLISGRGGEGKQQDATVSRRIREQAKARAVVDQVAQEELERKAEESRRSGDYQSAEVQYRAALEVGDRLAKLEQKESVEQSTRNDQLRSELASNAVEARQMKTVQTSGKARRRGLFRSSGGKGKAASYSYSYDGEGKQGVLDESAQGEREADDKSAPMKSRKPPADPGDVNGYLGGDFAAGVDEDDAYGAMVGGQVADEPAADKPAEPAEPVVAVAPDATKTEPPAAATTPVSRDFAEVLVAAPGVAPQGTSVQGSEDTAAPSPAFGTVSAQESRFTIDGGVGVFKRARQAMDARRVARESRLAGTGVKRQNILRRPGRGTVRSKDVLDTKFKDDEPQRGPMAGLPAPTVTASALSVVVPSLGVAVLYERALLPAGAEHRVDISAREPLISRE